MTLPTSPPMTTRVSMWLVRLRHCWTIAWSLMRRWRRQNFPRGVAVDALNGTQGDVKFLLSSNVACWVLEWCEVVEAFLYCNTDALPVPECQTTSAAWGQEWPRMTIPAAWRVSEGRRLESPALRSGSTPGFDDILDARSVGSNQNWKSGTSAPSDAACGVSL